MNLLEQPNVERKFILTEDQSAAIDGLRGFLAIAVFLYHCAWNDEAWVASISPLLLKIFQEGGRAPSIFFVLSGFLISLSYANLSARHTRGVDLRFNIRRFFRIWPLWFVALLVTFLLQGIDSPKFFFWNFFFIFGFQPYDVLRLPVPQAWSLFAEEVFYFSYPALIRFIKKFGVVLVLLFFMGLTILWTRFGEPLWVPANLQWDTPLTTFSLFLTGILFFRFRRAKPPLGRAASWILDLLIILGMYFSSVTHFTFALHILGALMLFAALYSKGLFYRLFAKILRPLGLRCYSIYLTHMWALDYFMWPRQRFPFLEVSQLPATGLIALFVLSTATMLVIAEICYQLIERPSHVWGRRLSEY